MIESSTQTQRPVPPPAPPVAPYAEPADGRRTGWFVGLLLLLLMVLAGLLFAFWSSLGIEEAPQAKVPDLIGKPITEAETLAKREGFVVNSTAREDAADKDQVIDQQPKAGEPVDKGAGITLIYSSGPKKGLLPDLTGKCVPIADARALLEGAGFLNVIEQPEPSNACKDGQVIAQDPSPAEHPVDTPIRLSVRSRALTASTTSTTAPRSTTSSSTTTEPETTTSSTSSSSTTSSSTTTTTTTTTMPEQPEDP